MGLFSRKPKADDVTTVTISGEELSRAARELNRGNQGPADDLIGRAGRDEGMRQSIAMRILGASVGEQ